MSHTFFSESPELQEAKKELEKKRLILANMQQSLQKGCGIAEKFNQKILYFQYELNRIEDELSGYAKPDSMTVLQEQRKQYQDYIMKTTQRLDPYLERIQQLRHDIQSLQTEVEHCRLTEGM